VDAVDNRGVIIMTFYRAIGWRKAGDQGEEDNGSGTLMVSITGDQNGKGGVMGHVCFLGKKGRRRGGSMVSETDDTMKSSMAIGEAEGGGWRLRVKDDQRKLGRWVECAVGLNY
jgi:hypothetical protein